MINFSLLNGLITQPTSRTKHNKQALDDNIQIIASYLQSEDHQSMKLTCQSFYYYFVTAEIWTGLKLGIAQQKMQYYYDDLQFEETQVKAISKKDKNIRIHSLKKQKSQQNSKDGLNKERPRRQASNIKQKGKLINANNQLLFRNTQIGFKRLLKANPKKKPNILATTCDIQYQNLQSIAIQLPKNFDLNDYIIKTKDPWSINIHRAHNTIALVKKWNDYQHKIMQSLKKPAKQFNQIIQNIKNVQQKISIYCIKFQQEPYLTILNSIQGAQQNLLIDEQLNKVCKLFWEYHKTTLAISKQMQIFIDALKNDSINITKANNKFEGQGVEFVQIFGSLEQAAQNYIQICQKNIHLGKILCPNILNVFINNLQNHQSTKIGLQTENKLVKNIPQKTTVSIQTICWDNLANNPNYFEILLQIMLSFCSKLQKLIQTHCANQLTLSMISNRVKNTKNIIHNLWNIAKYFNKLHKQAQAKKNKKDNKIQAIKQFFNWYTQGKSSTQLYMIKNPSKIDKDMADFKEKINLLKEKMQKI